MNGSQWMFTESGKKQDGNPRAGLPVFLQKFLKFFASLKLAVIVILALMVVLSAGTIIESLHGADAAKILVYDSAWFTFILLLLGVNVAGATIDRLPWKKKHVPFLITHLGILIILAGSLITRASMIDGQMPIAEGETESFITLPDPLVYVYSEDLRRDWIFPVQKKAFAWSGRERLKAEGREDLEVYLRHYYPKARVFQTVREAAEGPAAVQVTLHNSFLNQSQWLRADDPRLGSLQMGPARLVFTEEAPAEGPVDKPLQPYLEFQFKEKNLRVAVPEDLQAPAALKIEGTPYQITIQRILENAVVVGRELKDEPLAPGASGNPAVEFVLEGPGLKERHTVFARFPDFPTVHGMKPSAAEVRVFYHVPAGKQAEGHELRLFHDAEKGLLYQIRDGEEIHTGQAEAGKDIETGWMDLKFRVDAFYPHSRMEKEFVPQPNTSEAEDLVSAVEIEVGSGETSQRHWLVQGVREKALLGKTPFHFIYGQRRIPLGFKVELRDFKIEHYPGTEQPARFSSDVVLKDDTRGIVRDVHVSMNEPLEHRGFKIYQAAYSQAEDGREISIFSVGRDPGIPFKYIGSLVMIAGIIMLFSMRRFRKAERG